MFEINSILYPLFPKFIWLLHIYPYVGWMLYDT